MDTVCRIDSHTIPPPCTTAGRCSSTSRPCLQGSHTALSCFSSYTPCSRCSTGQRASWRRCRTTHLHQGWLHEATKTQTQSPALFQLTNPPPLVKLQKMLFKNCSNGVLYVKIGKKNCSPVHPDTFYCIL